MSLADCIGKMGKALSNQDAAVIQSYVDGGLGEMEAIDLHLSTMGETQREATFLSDDGEFEITVNKRQLEKRINVIEKLLGCMS
jgi:hypothetical protein